MVYVQGWNIKSQDARKLEGCKAFLPPIIQDFKHPSSIAIFIFTN